MYRFHQGDRILPFAASEYDARLAGLRRAMAEQGVDACVFTPMHNIAYYSGFLYCSFMSLWPCRHDVRKRDHQRGH